VIIKSESYGAGRGNTRLCVSVRDRRPLAVARLRPVDLGILLDAHLSRVQPRIGAAIAGNLAGVHARRGADGGRHLHIRCSAGAAQFPQLFSFSGCVASVMATTSSVESNFSHLRYAKTDNWSNLTCIVMEGYMQASDLIAIAREMAVPIAFHRW
jgi:hypothetical protein